MVLDRWHARLKFYHHASGLLLRYLAFLSNWAHSFSRLFAVMRTCPWRKWDLLKLLGRYGTASGSFRTWRDQSRPFSLAFCQRPPAKPEA